jgi:hypothetical protein
VTLGIVFIVKVSFPGAGQAHRQHADVSVHSGHCRLTIDLSVSYRLLLGSAHLPFFSASETSSPSQPEFACHGAMAAVPSSRMSDIVPHKHWA